MAIPHTGGQGGLEAFKQFFPFLGGSVAVYQKFSMSWRNQVNAPHIVANFVIQYCVEHFKILLY